MATISARIQKQVVMNVVFSIFTAFTMILLTRASASVFTPVAYGLFMLIRRYNTGLNTFAHLGISTAQNRFMGLHASDEKLCNLVDFISFLCYLVISLVLLVVTYLFSDVLISVLLPADFRKPWVLWVTVLLAIESFLYFNVIANWLHKRQILLYNVYRLLNASLISWMILLVMREPSVEEVFVYFIIISAVILIPWQLKYTILPIFKLKGVPWEDFKRTTKEMLVFALPRAPINFLNMALFLIGPWLIRDDLMEVGPLLTIYMFMQSNGVILLPLNQLIMIVSARRLSGSSREDLEIGVSLVFSIILIASLTFVCAIYPWIDSVFDIFIGNKEIVAGTCRYSILIWCFIPLSVFNALKGFVEINLTTPYNLINLFFVNVLGVALFFICNHYFGQLIALKVYAMTTFWVLGFITVLPISSYLSFVRWKDLLTFTGMSAAVMLLNFALRELLSGNQWMVGFKLGLIVINALVLPISWVALFRPNVIDDLMVHTGWSHRYSTWTGRFFKRGNGISPGHTHIGRNE